jgi:hypothetical protein
MPGALPVPVRGALAPPQRAAAGPEEAAAVAASEGSSDFLGYTMARSMRLGVRALSPHSLDYGVDVDYSMGTDDGAMTEAASSLAGSFLGSTPQSSVLAGNEEASGGGASAYYGRTSTSGGGVRPPAPARLAPRSILRASTGSLPGLQGNEQ